MSKGYSKAYILSYNEWKALETADELIGTSELIQAKAANKVNENIEHGYFQVELRDKIDF